MGKPVGGITGNSINIKKESMLLSEIRKVKIIDDLYYYTPENIERIKSKRKEKINKNRQLMRISE